MDAERDIEERLAYLNLDEADLESLAGIRSLLEQRAPALVSSFYRHLLSFEPTRRLLRDPEVTGRLMGEQRRYLLSLASPRVDSAYVAERLRIGAAHERIHLEPRWYLGAYALYFSLLTPMIWEHFDDRDVSERTVSALLKRLILDAQLAMETYIERREHDLERLNRELAAHGRKVERDLERRTGELRATTRRAQAAEALASVGTLVAGLAHEIGTPMGVIQGHAQLLETRLNDEEARWRLRTIQEQIERISKIMHALLNMARPREPERAPVVIEAVIDRALSFLGERVRRQGIEVVREVQLVPSVMGDADRLQQLFLNLFLNATDAMADGGRLTVSVRPAAGSENVIEVCVGDTGSGIAESDLGRLFDPFFTTKPAGQGHGLGLVVAHSIVIDHGGSIEAANPPDGGAEFRITLPCSARGSGATRDRTPPEADRSR